uniref:Pectinesterase n=1 Tax=Oryza punctata TaxID=4537 RepID=A0A0E0LSE0_ORYPU
MKHYYKTALLQYWVVLILLWLVATEEQLAAVAGAAGGSSSTATTSAPSAGQLPLWVRPGDRRLLGMAVAGMAADAVVAADGTGQYTTIKQALEAAEADNSGRRYTIHVKAGKYVEDVEIWRPNIAMIGDGIGRTIISGRKSVSNTRGTACTGTLNVQSDRFIARDLTVENTAGPEAMQAAAVVVKSNCSVFFRCEITGYQDTLLADRYWQFYRECVISGTIDFVWGEATAVFQKCLLLARRPLEGGHNVITAQGRTNDTDPVIAPSGFVFQACNH